MTAPLKPGLVVDSCAIVALLIDAGRDGEWVAEQLGGATLFAPQLMPYEVANILRRNRLAGLVDESAASLAHDDLQDLRINMYPYDVVAERVWQLRDNLTVYDAAYVALAEQLEVPLVTIDIKLAHASGPGCPILTPGMPMSG